MSEKEPDFEALAIALLGADLCRNQPRLKSKIKFELAAIWERNTRLSPAQPAQGEPPDFEKLADDWLASWSGKDAPKVRAALIGQLRRTYYSGLGAQRAAGSVEDGEVATLRSPEYIARDIVSQFAWTSNVMLNGRMVGMQVAVAAAIGQAIRIERDLIERLAAERAENEASRQEALKELETVIAEKAALAAKPGEWKLVPKLPYERSLAKFTHIMGDVGANLPPEAEHATTVIVRFEVQREALSEMIADAKLLAAAPPAPASGEKDGG